MAPEMIIGEPVDARTDVYLLGATLHVILTGKPRNAGLKLHETLVGAVEPAPFAYAPSVPEELVALCRRATAFDRAERLPTAMAMRQAIADYRHHKSSIALAQSAQERLARVRTLVRDSASRGNPDIQRDIDLLGAEARFALEQALREWSDNAVAQAASEASCASSSTSGGRGRPSWSGWRASSIRGSGPSGARCFSAGWR